MPERDYGLGRLVAPDVRDRRFPMRALLVPRRLPASRLYRGGAILDQGSTSMCVEYSWRAWSAAAPLMIKTLPYPFGSIYAEAQTVDEWDGEQYSGTSVRAGAKVLQAKGHIASYVWAATPEDVRDWILSGQGSVVVGTNWYAPMYEPDRRGFLTLPGTTATPVGGHAYLLIGFSGPRQAFRVVNSWSRAWGQSGRAWLSWSDFSRLHNEEGEAAAASEQRLAPVA